MVWFPYFDISSIECTHAFYCQYNKQPINNGHHLSIDLLRRLSQLLKRETNIRSTLLYVTVL